MKVPKGHPLIVQGLTGRTQPWTLFTGGSPRGEGGMIMPDESAKKPPQSETRTKDNRNLPRWKAPSLADLLQQLSVNSANPSKRYSLSPLARIGESTMENEQEHPQSHEEREVQTLVERIEQMEVTQEAAREAETKRTIDDFRKTV